MNLANLLSEVSMVVTLPPWLPSLVRLTIILLVTTILPCLRWGRVFCLKRSIARPTHFTYHFVGIAPVKSLYSLTDFHQIPHFYFVDVVAAILKNSSIVVQTPYYWHTLVPVYSILNIFINQITLFVTFFDCFPWGFINIFWTILFTACLSCRCLRHGSAVPTQHCFPAQRGVVYIIVQKLVYDFFSLSLTNIFTFCISSDHITHVPLIPRLHVAPILHVLARGGGVAQRGAARGCVLASRSHKHTLHFPSWPFVCVSVVIKSPAEPHTRECCVVRCEGKTCWSTGGARGL